MQNTTGYRYNVRRDTIMKYILFSVYQVEFKAFKNRSSDSVMLQFSKYEQLELISEAEVILDEICSSKKSLIVLWKMGSRDICRQLLTLDNLRDITTFSICFCISKNTPFYCLAIADHAVGWCRGYPEVSFTGRTRFKEYMKMGKFHPFLKALVFFQLASFRRSVLLTEEFSQQKKYTSMQRTCCSVQQKSPHLL